MKHLPKLKNRIAALYTAGGALILLSALLGFSTGSTALGIKELFAAIFSSDRSSPEARIFWYVRFPRTVASLVAGGALALSGAILQKLLANKLASPSIIGVNSGAGLFVVIASSLGIFGGWRLSLFAFLGAAAAVLLVATMSRRFGASRSGVILMGVALNAFFGAISDAIISFSPDAAISSGDFKIGDFSSVSYEKLIPASVIILISFSAILLLSNELDVLALGDDSAKGLGLNTSLMRTVFLMLTALLAGSAVSIAGQLSFVGLLVPHAVRKLSASSAHTLPLSFILGAGFVSLSDTLSRVVFAPYEIPVGIIMAFIGAPAFVVILIKGKGGHGND